MAIQFLLDTADPDQWKDWASTGLFNGITTNPSLLRASNQLCNFKSLKELALKAEDAGFKELHLQAWGESPDDIAECGYALGQLSTKSLNIHIKIPITQIGCKAAKELIQSNFSITFTACYAASQVLLAAALKATYIAPYLGRMNDKKKNGLVEVTSMQKMLHGIDSKCKILVASIRTMNEITDLTIQGLSTFTISPKLAKEFFNVPETLEAARNFQEDALKCI